LLKSLEEISESCEVKSDLRAAAKGHLSMIAESKYVFLLCFWGVNLKLQTMFGISASLLNHHAFFPQSISNVCILIFQTSSACFEEYCIWYKGITCK